MIGEPNAVYAKYFISNSYIADISDSQITFANVTFEPRCRNNWHIHHARSGGGQMLVGIAGRGWHQEEGSPAVEIFRNGNSYSCKCQALARSRI